MARSRIGLDLDGVCYDFTGSYRYLLKKHRGVDFPAGDDWITDWYAMDRYMTAEDKKWLWSIGVREKGLFRYGKLKKGTIEGVQELSKLGRIEVITHRPEGAIRDTLAFLEYVDFPLAGVHILTNEEPKSSVGCDIYVDDGPHVIEEIQDAGKQIVIVDAPYNREIHRRKDTVRAYGWVGRNGGWQGKTICQAVEQLKEEK